MSRATEIDDAERRRRLTCARNIDAKVPLPIATTKLNNSADTDTSNISGPEDFNNIYFSTISFM